MNKDTKPPVASIQPGSEESVILELPTSAWRRGFRKLWRRLARKPRGSFERPPGRILTVEVEDENLRPWPSVRITAEAHGKMRALIEACPVEVSWLATCTRHGDDVTIDNIVVPRQICSLGTTDVTHDGEAELLAALMAEKQYDSIRKLNCWGHSHVRSAVFASGTDEAQTQDFIIRAKDMRKSFFVRLIANKWDDLFATLYLFDQGLVFQNVPLRVDHPETDKWRVWAQREIRLKVKKIHVAPVKIKPGQMTHSTDVVNVAAAGQLGSPMPFVHTAHKKEDSQ